MEKLIEHIQATYGLQVLEFYPHQNIWCLETSMGKKCLKKVRYSKEDAVFIWLATENLYANGFDRFNRFVLTKKGEPYCEYQGSIYTLSNWVAGRESDYTDKNYLTIAVQTLVDLHKASQGFFPPSFGRQRIKWGYWIDNFEERLEELKKFKGMAIGKDTFFDELFFNNADVHIEEGHEAISILKNSEYFNIVEQESPLNGFCHHDYAYHNVLINEGQGYLIDFDYIICDLRCHDLGSLIMRAIKDNGWQGNQTELILTEYERRAPLKKGEGKVMYGFLKFPQDFWQAGYTYYIERNRPQERMEKRLKNCVTAIDTRAQCLRELAKSCCER